HTRFSRDWSSDVCSSDLPEVGNFQPPLTTSRDSGASVAWRSLFDVVPSRGSGRLGGRLRAPRLCCGARPRNLRDPGHVNGGYTPGCAFSLQEELLVPLENVV